MKQTGRDVTITIVGECRFIDGIYYDTDGTVPLTL